MRESPSRIGDARGAAGLVRSLTRLSEYLRRGLMKGTFPIRRLGYGGRKYPQNACRDSRKGLFRQPVTVAAVSILPVPTKLSWTWPQGVRDDLGGPAVGQVVLPAAPGGSPTA